jgi:hypothetical protein
LSFHFTKDIYTASSTTTTTPSTMLPTSTQDDSQPTASMPRPSSESAQDGPTSSTDADMSSYSSSRSGSTSEAEGPRKPHQKMQRPKLHTRKSSGTIIIPRDDPNVEVHDEHYDEGDARTMSPRRSSEEVERLEEGARQTMIEFVWSILYPRHGH